VLRQACQVPRLLRLIQYVDFTGCSPEDTAALNRLGRVLGIPDDPDPPVPPPVSRLWLYGTVGGVLALGVLIAGLVLSPSEQPKPPTPPPVKTAEPRQAFCAHCHNQPNSVYRVSGWALYKPYHALGIQRPDRLVYQSRFEVQRPQR
jgi:hypothetical protein